MVARRGATLIALARSTTLKAALEEAKTALQREGAAA